jgi:hypothetical protein
MSNCLAILIWYPIYIAVRKGYKEAASRGIIYVVNYSILYYAFREKYIYLFISIDSLATDKDARPFI